jgi:hypothetical protein
MKQKASLAHLIATFDIAQATFLGSSCFAMKPVYPGGKLSDLPIESGGEH